jgi:hypothetical protein
MIKVLRLFDMTERGLVHIPEYKNKKIRRGIFKFLSACLGELNHISVRI